MNRAIYGAYLPIVWMVASLLFNVGSIAQEETNTPEPVTPQRTSIFANDVCNPPCWFGLIPGESSSQDVLQFLVSSEWVFEPRLYNSGRWTVIDFDSPPIFDGRYIFDMGPAEHILCCGVYSHAAIYEGILDRVNITVLENITFNEVIINMGLPDEIRMSRFVTLSGQPTFLLEFIYYELYIRMTIAPNDRYSEPEMCHLSALGDGFLVSTVTYYSQRNATELVNAYLPSGGREEQPTLLAYYLESRHIPVGLWTILLGEKSFDCQELWSLLPEDRILPDWWNGNHDEN
jgi:hypothetical protein